MADLVGQQMGNYLLQRKLGEGGFAEVYLGEHIHLGTQAAIKVLHTQLSGDSTDEFRIEARTIARLIHPNIVRVLEFDIKDKTPFLVMDYATNGTLRQKHTRGVQLPLDTIVTYVKQIADALNYAHEEKLIHRDVKPENMLVGRRNEILLSDFGIALVAQSSRFQSTQEVIGTVAYMAPEQIQGKPRPASDQYALAIVVYEWLTGTRPFHGSFTELCTQHMFAPPPPLREKLPDVPADVELVLMTALAKDAKARFGSIQAFANALEQASKADSATPPTIRSVLNTEPIAPPPPPQPQYGRFTQPGTPQVSPDAPVPYNPYSGGSSGRITPPVGPAPHERNRFGAGTSQKLPVRVYDRHIRAIRALAWSANSQRIASAGVDSTIHVWEAPSGRALQVYSQHKDSVNALAWSANQESIISGGDDKTVHKWQVATAQSMFVYRGFDELVRTIAYLSNSQMVVVGGTSREIHVFGAIRGQRILTYTRHGGGVNALTCSPNERYIASSGDDGTVHIWDVTSGQNQLIYKEHMGRWVWIQALAWSPDGSRIASGDANGKIHIWDPQNGKRIALCSGHTGRVYSLSWSPDSQFVASGSGDSTMQIWNGMTGETVNIYHQPAVINAVAWSPDGSRIVTGGDDAIARVWMA